MKRKTWIAVCVALAMAAALLWSGGNAEATNAIAKRENLVCTVCHDKPGSKLLTDQGLYYEVVGSLKGYREVEGAFGQCTYCHDRRPGAEKLTPEGARLMGVVEDMEGLQDWVVKSHPEAIREAIEAAEGTPMAFPGADEPVEMEVEPPEGPPPADGDGDGGGR